MCVFITVFFFKQKTAYELRISDCSSDVCSSDLASDGVVIEFPSISRSCRAKSRHPEGRRCRWASRLRSMRTDARDRHFHRLATHAAPVTSADIRLTWQPIHRQCRSMTNASFRSEENTSELQSLMRLSYADF